MKARLSYPEKRVVSEETIIGWFMDAIANHEIGPDWFHASKPREMAAGLEDAGLITVAEWLP